MKQLTKISPGISTLSSSKLLQLTFKYIE